MNTKAVTKPTANYLALKQILPKPSRLWDSFSKITPEEHTAHVTVEGLPTQSKNKCDTLLLQLILSE